MTDWQREMAQRLAKMFDDTVNGAHVGGIERHLRERRRFSIASAMAHLLSDLAEGKTSPRVFAISDESGHLVPIGECPAAPVDESTR